MIHRNDIQCTVFSSLFHVHYISLASLNNVSKEIRWSLDLRWQKSDLPVGFFGMKPGIMMRSQRSEVKVEWEAFRKAHFHDIYDDELKVS